MRGRACASFGGLCSREVPIESSAILSGGRAGERETVVINFESASGECLTLLDSQAGDIADQLEVPGASRRAVQRGSEGVPAQRRRCTQNRGDDGRGVPSFSEVHWATKKRPSRQKGRCRSLSAVYREAEVAMGLLLTPRCKDHHLATQCTMAEVARLPCPIEVIHVSWYAPSIQQGAQKAKISRPLYLRSAARCVQLIDRLYIGPSPHESMSKNSET